MPGRRSATEGGSQYEATAGYFGPLRSAKYVLLTTFQEDGIPISTHVHGVVDGDRAYFRAWRQSDTAKRLRHTDDVQVTACPMLGLTVGPPLDAVARLLSGEEASWVARKLARKYPLRQRFLIPLLRRTRGWQLAHYELLTYEAAASQDLYPDASSHADRHVCADSELRPHCPANVEISREELALGPGD
jgi:PPOX class probable F420-dependent enzyme